MDLDSSQYYLDKHKSWLKFNERVLEEACDGTTPLLEKLKYLAITVSNLDEFFMVRIARLKERIACGVREKGKAGYYPRELFQQHAVQIHQMMKKVYQTYHEILPELKEEGIILKNSLNLNKEQKEFTHNYFQDVIFPTLTPMAIDQSKPFPLIASGSLNIGLCLQSKQNSPHFPHKEGKELISVVQVPAILSRLVRIPDKKSRCVFVYLEEIIKENIASLFTGYKVKSLDTFRITRNADVNLDEYASNFLLEMEQYIKRRKWGFPVRLELEEEVNIRLYEFLKKALELNESDIYKLSGPLDLAVLMDMPEIKGFDHLKFKNIVPQVPAVFLNKDNIFHVVKDRDILLHHPYESFQPVIDFVRKAASDPQVLAIKQTLYRVSGDSPIIKALTMAARKGKQVTVIVELKARFSEAENIEWAKKLEKAGCHVIYGLIGFKVHAKLLLVIRSEEGGSRKYVHISTGNYNDQTAQVYTDIGLLTANQDFGTDISHLFNLLTGYSAPPQWKKIAVAPLNLRDKFRKLIENEIKQVKAGKKGHIIAKMNALVDKEIIKNLYRAAKEGVKIDLIVRGICCLKAGMEGVSENIQVVSIVGKLLEHSRIYYFLNAGQEDIFLTSADWRPRNLDRRVEVLFPVEEKNLKKRLKKVLDICLKDNVKARIQQPDGSYCKKVELKQDDADLDKFECQLEFHYLAQKRLAELAVQESYQ